MSDTWCPKIATSQELCILMHNLIIIMSSNYSGYNGLQAKINNALQSPLCGEISDTSSVGTFPDDLFKQCPTPW